MDIFDCIVSMDSSFFSYLLGNSSFKLLLIGKDVSKMNKFLLCLIVVGSMFVGGCVGLVPQDGTHILCNDGTISPTCSCSGSHRGCCSSGGGIARCY
jgi:hypothetical protein